MHVSKKFKGEVNLEASDDHPDQLPNYFPASHFLSSFTPLNLSLDSFRISQVFGVLLKGLNEPENIFPFQQITIEMIKASDTLKRNIILFCEYLADEHKNAYAMAVLSLLCRQPWLPEKNETQCFEWAEKSSSQGNSFGITLLGWCHQYIKHDAKQANELFMEGTKKQNPLAKFHLAFNYEHGYGFFEKDIEKSTYYLHQSAEMGCAVAMNCLAYNYETGTGVEQDHSKSLAWYKEASKLNETNALVNLSYHYQQGDLVPVDLEKAFKLLEQAAQLNNSSALVSLGYCCLVGKGTRKNVLKSIDFYQRASYLQDSTADSELERIKRGYPHQVEEYRVNKERLQCILLGRKFDPNCAFAKDRLPLDLLKLILSCADIAFVLGSK